MGGRAWAGWSGVKGRKWDNCNSIINKYVKKNKIKKKKRNKTVRENKYHMISLICGLNEQNEQTSKIGRLIDRGQQDIYGSAV